MRHPSQSAVIEFPQRRVRRDARVAAGPAEVVIFSGVRIERMHDLAERLPPARTGSASKARAADADFY